MTLNHDLVRTRCQEISDSLDRLEKIGKEARGKFLKETDSRILPAIACWSPSKPH